MNSLLLLRDCVMKGGSAREAASVILRTRRGVPWNYVLSDGGTDTACTVEAGASWAHTDYMSYPPPQIRPYLPGAAFLERYPYAPIKDGVAIRWYGEPVPQEYLHFNPGLWQIWNATNAPRITPHPDALSRTALSTGRRTRKIAFHAVFPAGTAAARRISDVQPLSNAGHALVLDGRVRAAVTRGMPTTYSGATNALREQLRKRCSAKGRSGLSLRNSWRISCAVRRVSRVLP